MPNINDLKQSRFLTQGDVEKPILVTIADVRQMNVAKEGADEEKRWVLLFEEIDKPMTLNVTNGQIIAEITGSEEFPDGWKGHRIVLYRDKNVMFAGERKGGIRVRAPKEGYVHPQEATEPEPINDDIPF